MQTVIKILADEPIGTVTPRLYGHFAEHLGRCCYEGLWVGTGADVACEDGFRCDIVRALAAMPTPLLRWPGGCYADHYHWRDGIGPAEDRPLRLGLSCGRRVREDNGLGTHEFLALCDLIGAEPYLAGNMGSGSVQELCDWVEYCNCELDTALARERAANGRRLPWGVKLWGIGNENWGCGGNFDPESYALEYRRYSLMVRMVDPRIEMVFCGHDQTWNERSLRMMRHHLTFVDHFSIHRYWTEGGAGKEFSEKDYYALLCEADRTEEFVVQTRELIEETSGGRKKIGIALDEWGVWHPEARTWGPGGTATEIGDYSQAGTLRDALAAAIAFEGFHRQCDSLSLANLAQIVNVLHAPAMTEGDRMWLTPTYYLLQMHACHMGETAYRTVVEGAEDASNHCPSVSATATSGGITITNRHFARGAVVRFSLAAELGQASVLGSDMPSDENGPGDEEKVRTKPLKTCRDGGDIVLELPPHSVATVSFTL